MKYLIKSIIGFFAVTLLICQNSNADTVVPSDRVVSSLKVRAEASSNSDVVGRLYPGHSAQYIDSAPHWYHIRLNNDIEGYVYKSWSRLITDSAGQLEVHFINVGQGDSTLVICPDGENILVDAGSDGGASIDYIRDYIMNVLDTHERNINTLVITHPHTDHYNLIPDVLRGIPVNQVIMVGENEDYNNRSFLNWLNNIPNSNKTVLQSGYFNPDNQPNIAMDCGDASVYVLASAINSTFSRKNTMGIVLMVRYGDFEVILTGDATRVTEAEIIGRYPNNWLDSDVLKVGHHGSLSTSTTQEWAEVVNPQTAVVSAGVQNSHGHPRREIIERLDDFTSNNAPEHIMTYATGTRGNYTWHNNENYEESIYSTAVNGNIVITSNGNEFTINTVHYEE